MKVAMLVNNACVVDTRVIKQAKALVHFGHKVTVLCLDDGKAAQHEVINGVTYVRFQQWADTPSHLIEQKKITRIRESHLFGGTSLHVKLLLVLNVLLVSLTAIINVCLDTVVIVIKKNSGIRKTILKTVTPSVLQYLMHCKMYIPYLKKEKFDVIHAHDLDTLPAGVIAARDSKNMVIYDSHELEMHRNATYTKWEAFLRRKIETYLIHQVKEVITVCDSIADFLKDDYKIKQPHVILNGPDTTQEEPVDGDVRLACGVTSNTPLGVYIGTVSINRGLDFCIRALAHAPEMHLATVGPRRPCTEKYILEEATAAGVLDRLHLIDAVGPQQVTSFVKTADFSLVPIQNSCLSYYFCFPNKLFESALSGLPIAGARLVEIEKFIEHTNTGLIMDETSPEDIARAMREIYKDKSRYIMTPEKKAHILQEYGWETQKVKLKEIYNTF